MIKRKLQKQRSWVKCHNEHCSKRHCALMVNNASFVLLYALCAFTVEDELNAHVGWCSEYQPKGGNALRLGIKGRYGSCVGGRQNCVIP